MPPNFPSAEGRTQWRMTTIGCVPWLQWNYVRQYVHVTDDGTVWIVANNWYQPFTEDYTGEWFVGRILDDGSIQRVSPDGFSEIPEGCT